MDSAYLFFIANYLAQGMIGIAYEPIGYLLKDVLHLTAGQSATFAAWMSAPFLIKPLFGWLTDAFPLFGRRRGPYLVLWSVATCAGWLALARLRVYAYLPTLFLLTAVNVGIAFCDVLCDAVMVERGQALKKTGVYQAVQIGTLYLTLLATGLGGGWLAEHASYSRVFALTALFPLLILATIPLAQEGSAAAPNAPRRAFVEIRMLATNSWFWRIAFVILLYNFNPFRGTPFFYFQSDALRFSKTFIGTLTSVGGVAGVVGAAAFGWVCKTRPRWVADTGRWLRFNVILGVILTFSYLGYSSTTSALALTALTGACEVFMRLGLMDVAARVCPRGLEATSFALLISAFNLAAWSSNTLGGKWFGAWSAGPAGPAGAMARLILLSALATAACWPLARGDWNFAARKDGDAG